MPLNTAIALTWVWLPNNQGWHQHGPSFQIRLFDAIGGFGPNGAPAARTAEIRSNIDSTTLGITPLELEELLESADLTRKGGDLEEAAGLYEQILRRNSSSKSAAAGLGICLHKLGRASLALQYLSRVASQGCDDPEVYISLGNCYFAIGQFDLATTAFWRAVGLDPHSASSLVLLAHALVKKGDADEAERSILKAIDLEPGLATAYDLMAFLLPQMGRFTEAKEFARRATDLEPDNPAYCTRFVYGGKVTPDDLEFVMRLEAMSVSGRLSTADDLRVEYGLGKAYEDLDRYEDSLRHYTRANAVASRELDQRGNRFDAVTHRREVDYLIETYSEAELQRRQTSGVDSELPVFIVGMMRSGTTLTEQILSSHPDVAGAGELNFWVEAAPRTMNSSKATIQATANDYLKRLAKIGPGKSRVCDKMPQNYMSLGPIHAALPNARIIHCKRDPRDTCFSIFTIPFTHHPPFAYSAKNIAFAYRQYQRIMEHWRNVLPADRFTEVEYEELVANQKTESQRLIQFLGLEWSESCLFPENNTRVVNTPSRWQVRQPVYNRSVLRWKRFEPWLGSMVSDWSLINEL